MSLRRQKAEAEQKEIEVRQELNRLRRATEGVNAEECRSLQSELGTAKRALADLRMEYEAARSKLEVYA